MRKNQIKSIYEIEADRRRKRRTAIRWVCRGILAAFVCLGLFVYNGYAHLNRIFSGPSDAAKLQTLEHLAENSMTAWIPGFFLNYQEIADLRVSAPRLEDSKDPENIYIPVESKMYQGTPDDEWADWPDGIQIQKIGGAAYEAYAILIRDPSRVSLTLSNQELDPSLKGKTMSEIMESTGAVAAINASEIHNTQALEEEKGSLPLGKIVSGSRIAWDEGFPHYKGAPRYKGFVGINSRNELKVSSEVPEMEEIVGNMDIRDGCSTGPALVIGGRIHEKALKQLPQIEPHSAIGQRKDGTIIFLCMDGWQPSSAGGSLLELAKLMQKLEAENACALDGGYASMMMYRDTAGKFGTANAVYTVNSPAALSAEPVPMPTYWLVQSVKED